VTTDWSATVLTLDAVRARAFVTLDVSLLDLVYTAGSAARTADSHTIATLAARGLTVSGAGHRMQRATMLSRAPIRVQVQDLMPSYELLDSTGKVVGATPARAAAIRVMVLVGTPAGYRISEVLSS